MKKYQSTSITLHPQECGGDYTFSSEVYVTRGLKNAFGEAFEWVVSNSLQMLQTERIGASGGADYLQVFDYEGTRYWCIDDLTHVTFLLPEDY